MKPAFLSFFVFVLFANFCPATAREPRPEAAKANFSAQELPAERDDAAILSVSQPGRYSIRAKSGSGARIEIVDMIAGPGESSGAAGVRDGRIDLLLDKGAYKIRVSNPKGATGKVRLTADPFVEANASRPRLVAERIESAELGDLQQRSYALEVDATGRVSVEAAGRALHDLRLWREDGELVELPLERQAIEPKPGHALTLLRLEGAVAPGRYVVTAYGGEKRAWTDGSPALPLLLRLAAPAALWAGVAEGVIGPFGVARFEAAPAYNAFRLELPEIAAARLLVERGKLKRTAAIEKNSREPVAQLGVDDEDKPARIEIAGSEGQKFSLRAVRQASRHAFEGEGPYWLALDVAGDGGDEVPAAALLARIDKDGKTQVLASDAPSIGQSRALRARFNLRGPTSLLFEARTPGPVAIGLKGVKVRATIEPALGSLAARADGRDPDHYDLQAGFYFLSLEPQGEATGPIDVTLGPPGLALEPSPAPAPSASITFGRQTLEKGASYLMLANRAPMLLMGPRVVALPADLAAAPLPLWQTGDAEISMPVRAPKNGAMVARDAKGAAIPFKLSDEKLENDIRFATVAIAASGRARAIGLGFVPQGPKIEPGTDDAGKSRAAAPLAAGVGAPAYFDLARDETRTLRFELAQGGLYRIETLGRLRTAIKLGTTFAPGLAEGEDNGSGHNGLVTTYLRAGAYRAAVTARESNGHLGLSVTPARLETTPAITGEGEARATLQPGKGALVPLEIPSDGLYRIELLGAAREWRARLEDADGWPLAKPGVMTRVTRRLDKGSYRIVVAPEDVEARMALRVTPLATPPAPAGHGPHPLPFETPQKLQWREPQAGAARAPDVWRFSLQGEASVELSISEGMVAELIGGEAESLGKAAGGRKFARKLAAGDYRIEARALSRDDRLDYEISLHSDELQPGAPRRIELPATLPFSITADRLIDLVSFGDQPLLGVLKDASGAVVEKLASRADDWNIALSRRLPAGAYRLELQPLAAARGMGGKVASRKPEQDSRQDSQEEEAEQDSDEETSAAAGAQNQTEDQTEADAQRAGPAPRGGVELRLSLPVEESASALGLKGVQRLAGPDAHGLALMQAPEQSLMVVAAQSAREIALSVERRDGGVWRSIGVERGLSPVAAWPAPGGQQGEWRVVLWPVGGGDAAISVAARAIERRGRPAGEVALEPVADLPVRFCVGAANLSSASLVDLRAPADGLFAGSAPGVLLKEARSGLLAPQSERLWLVSRGDCEETPRVAAFSWAGGDEVLLDLGPFESAQTPALPAPPNKARIWAARAPAGPVGLDGGRGMAILASETLAPASASPLRIWNAAGATPLRLALRAMDVELLPRVVGGDSYRGLLPPMSAQPVTMNRGEAALELELPAGVAAFSAPEEARKFVAYGGEAALSRIENGAPDNLWLVNLSQQPQPARVTVSPGKSETLVFGRAIKRFHGVPGQLALPVEAQKGDRLVVIGGAARFVSKNGAVLAGETMTLDGGGDLAIDYKPGLLALWLERGDKGPWPAAAARLASMPQDVALAGTAMSFALHRDKPAMLHVRSGAPAILAFTQDGKREFEAFAAGVELHRYINAGDATLDIYPAHDGPLSGALHMDAETVIDAHEGVNDAITLAPGAGALFTFETKRDGEIGLGLRAEPDRAEARLLDANGRLVAEGVAQKPRLAQGRYFLEVRAPASAPLSVVRLAVLGVSPPPSGPPDEVVAEFLEKAGLKQIRSR